MTESEWMQCVDPRDMLKLFKGSRSGRRLRLVACACLRQIFAEWNNHDLPHETVVAERFADGETDRRELRAARSLLGARGGFSPAWAANCATHAVLYDSAFAAAQNANDRAVAFTSLLAQQKNNLDEVQHEEQAAAVATVRAQLAGILRDIFGNPFRPVTLDPRWLTSTVLDLARTIYDERDYERMPILADALMDAGCDSEEIIQHCQRPGPHVRGCWVVDLLLAKS